MTEADQLNVFVSHYNQDDEHIQGLKDLLESKGYQLKNSSIDSTKPNEASNEDYIRQLLRERIKWAGKVIVLIGPQTHTREWVNWEIEEASRLGKPIIGIYIQGATNADIPENLKLYGSALVGWNSDKIISALEGKCHDFIDTSGANMNISSGQDRSVC
jgi:hypothetical protein